MGTTDHGDGEASAFGSRLEPLIGLGDRYFYGTKTRYRSVKVDDGGNAGKNISRKDYEDWYFVGDDDHGTAQRSLEDWDDAYIAGVENVTADDDEELDADEVESTLNELKLGIHMPNGHCATCQEYLGKWQILIQDTPIHDYPIGMSYLGVYMNSRHHLEKVVVCASYLPCILVTRRHFAKSKGN